MGGGDVGAGEPVGGTAVWVREGVRVGVAVGERPVSVGKGAGVAVTVGGSGVWVGRGEVAVGEAATVGVGEGSAVGDSVARRQAASQPASVPRIRPTKVRREMGRMGFGSSSEARWFMVCLPCPTARALEKTLARYRLQGLNGRVSWHLLVVTPMTQKVPSTSTTEGGRSPFWLLYLPHPP